MSDKIYQNEIGKPIKLDCGEDITSASAYSIAVRKPDGTTDTWTATIEDGNYLQHITEAGDVDQAKTYFVQSQVTLNGNAFKGNTASFQVYPNFG